MTFEEVVEALSDRAGRAVDIDIRPMGSPKNAFGMLDRIDRVWTDDNGTAYVVTHEAEAGVSLRPSEFVEAELTSAAAPGGNIETTVRVRAGGIDIRFGFQGR